MEAFRIKVYNKKQLAAHYGVSQRTMYRWLKKLEPLLGTKIGNYYNIKQVEIIIGNLGIPVSKQNNEQ